MLSNTLFYPFLLELANGSNMHSTIREVFITTSQQSWFCMNINFWGQLAPESQTPFLPAVEWGPAQWAVLCFPWRQMPDTGRSRSGFSGMAQEGPLGAAWEELVSATAGRDRDTLLQRDRPWLPPYPLKVQKVFCLSQPPSVQGHTFLHYNTEAFNLK